MAGNPVDCAANPGTLFVRIPPYSTSPNLCYYLSNISSPPILFLPHYAKRSRWELRPLNKFSTPFLQTCNLGIPLKLELRSVPNICDSKWYVSPRLIYSIDILYPTHFPCSLSPGFRWLIPPAHVAWASFLGCRENQMSDAGPRKYHASSDVTNQRITKLVKKTTEAELRENDRRRP